MKNLYLHHPDEIDGPSDDELESIEDEFSEY